MALTGCATEQWKAAEAQCMMQAMPIFPVATEQRWVHELPPVPFMQKCVQVSYKDKDGKNLVRTECSMVPMMANYVRSCAQQSCFVSYGNTDCKLPSTEATPKP
ncbi:MAG: hypothetical protein EBT28_07160 [Betaproteobacteria bacterium]|nr:hypothetical protein [Betaproteobacteria bacterium]